MGIRIHGKSVDASDLGPTNLGVWCIGWPIRAIDDRELWMKKVLWLTLLAKKGVCRWMGNEKIKLACIWYTGLNNLLTGTRCEIGRSAPSFFLSCPNNYHCTCILLVFLYISYMGFLCNTPSRWWCGNNPPEFCYSQLWWMLSSFDIDTKLVQSLKACNYGMSQNDGKTQVLCFHVVRRTAIASCVCVCQQK